MSTIQATYPAAAPALGQVPEVDETGATAVCPHNYLSTVNQSTVLDLSASPVIPANTVIGIGVEAPTAVATNYYVNVVAGNISYTRVEP